MTRAYDNWGRLVRATLRREQLRLTSHITHSDLSLACSSSSSFSFGSFSPQASSFGFSPPLPGKSFSYDQILESLLRSNSILIKQGHSGDLYYGVLEGGIEAVIKKIDLSSLKNESHRYVSELEFLQTISHSRLVPLLGHCSESMNLKFLVYKYMPNKDLSCYLQGRNVPQDDHRDQFSSLDWITRLKIAIGAAEGLCYLHHECIPPIVHRDFQASSVLLDDDFEVRLGSLSELRTAQETVADKSGIVKFLRRPNGTERGTEEAPASVTTRSHDVYCLGVVLLQLVTGRLCLDDAIDFPDPAAPINRNKNWKALTLQIYDKELVRNILDPCLPIDEHLFLEVWALAVVARACLEPKLSRRPNAAQVLKALQQGKISDAVYFEMTRTLTSYRTFLGSISPKAPSLSVPEPFGSLSPRASSFDFSTPLPGKSFSYDQILESLSRSNSILIKQGHSGDLYYGVLQGGIEAVIKKIDLSSLKNESHRYVSELEFLQTISHSRLVPLLGHCLESMDLKFLVYKYMPKKDLSCYLRGGNVPQDGHRHQFSFLDWITRFNIAIGAAEALCYLHHECIPPIVHRDFQASSILLDDDFEVRLGSLSELRTALETVADKNGIVKFLRRPNGTERGTEGM